MKKYCKKTLLTSLIILISILAFTLTLSAAYENLEMFYPYSPMIINDEYIEVLDPYSQSESHDENIGVYDHLGGLEEKPPSSIIVKYKEGALPVQMQNLAQDFGILETSQDFGALEYSGVYVFPMTQIEESLDALMASLSQVDIIEYAEPNYFYYTLAGCNDPYYKYQWHMNNQDYGGINVGNAWDIHTGDTNVIVAVIDTGVAYEDYGDYEQAPDLANTSFVPGYDFVEKDDHPNDDHYHGTHVTGTIAQSTNNNLGTTGVAYNVSIMPIKVLDKNGNGTAATIAEGIYYAADNGADVINLSIGGPEPSKTMKKACEYAYNKGVTIVAASGNLGIEQVFYPAAYDDYVIAVGATRYDETRAPYSNYGAPLDIVGPGGDTDEDQNGDGYGDGVLQNTINPITKNPSDFVYRFLQGTSMATPHVTGVAALLVANGAAGPDNVRDILQSTAEDLGAAGWDKEYGYGLVDAHAALQAMSSCTYALSSSSRAFDSSGGEGGFQVITGDGCFWTAQSNSPWIWIMSGSSGNGDGTVSYFVSSNSGNARTGYIAIKDNNNQVRVNFRVNQKALTKKPTIVGSYNNNTPDYYVSIPAQGLYAYVSDAVLGLQVIDITNPRYPTLVGSCNTPGNPRAIYVQGSYVYLADNYSGLQVIDITNPRYPVIAGSYDTPNIAFDVHVNGPYAYVADGKSGLYVIDITNPRYPTLVGSCDTPNDAWGVYVQGSYAYVADGTSGLLVIDVTNPRYPAIIGICDTPDLAENLHVNGPYAYVANGASGLQVIDITNPRYPKKVGSCDTPGYAGSIYVHGSRAYVADGKSGLQVIDITNPRYPAIVNSCDTPDDAWGVHVYGAYAYVADGKSGLQVIEIMTDLEPMR